jgi:hypothetical protein
MEKLTIDGKEYLLDSLSDDAKAQLGALNLVDRKTCGPAAGHGNPPDSAECLCSGTGCGAAEGLM